MSGQLLRTITKGSGGQCTIELAQTVLSQGYAHVVDAIDPQVKEEVAQKTEAALQTPGVVPDHIKTKMNKVALTYAMIPLIPSLYSISIEQVCLLQANVAPKLVLLTKKSCVRCGLPRSRGRTGENTRYRKSVRARGNNPPFHRDFLC
jgi:hypothetical protein